MKIGFPTDAFNSAYWNIKQVLRILKDRGFDGVLSMECEGQGGPLIEKSLGWLRSTLPELGICEETY